MRELDGRVALVTGGGSGIGRGIALALAGAGTRVVVADIEPDAAEAIAAEIAGSGGDASAATLDVTDPAAVEALAERCFEEHGGVDVLCNNAGVIGPTPIGPEALDNWRWTLDVNVLGVVHVINAFVPRMRTRVDTSGGEAHVVNTASIGGLIAGYGWEISAYIASKFAVVSMSRNLRGELAGSGIGVSVLCPGGVETRIWEAGRNRPAEHGGPEAYDWSDRLARSAAIDPLTVGRHVLRAIRENQFYIITHTDRREFIEADVRELLDAFDRSDRDPLD